MGRPERTINPQAGPIAEFAVELRKLRETAGRPSYRELSDRARFSPAVLSAAAGGRTFPTLAVVKAYVRACGGDAEEWEQRWRHEARQQREAAVQSAPYLGLASYAVQHADLFFGREALTRDLLQRVGAGHFLALFGPSGSGKSSLLRAGLMAALERKKLPAAENWIAILLTPGEHPVAALAGHLAALTGTTAEQLSTELLATPAALHATVAQALADQAPDVDLLLVVDQFEELFTLCDDARQRDSFVRALLDAVTVSTPRVRVVLGIRTDFYTQCTIWPELVTALRDSQVLVGPMDPAELRDVIVQPAAQAGIKVERGLISTMLAETGSEPGTLALVSHALLEAWRNSPPGRLTLSAYTEAGGVSHAIASTAERVYAECDANQRPVLRRILLRLVSIGDGTPDVRRLVPRDELAVSDDPDLAATLIERLAQARLITVDDGFVQFAHEALIRFWPRLGEWLAEGRDGLGVQRRLSYAAGEWARLGHDPAALYQGTPLAVAQTWADGDADLTGLTSAEREFLAASSSAAAARQAAASRSARRLRRLVVALVILLAGATAAGSVAAWQRQTALSAESTATSGQLAHRSAALASVSPDAATLAALAAWRADPTVTARSALLSAECCAATQTVLGGEHAAVYALALSPDGGILAAGGQDDSVHLWNTADGAQLTILRGFAGPVRAVAFSPDGAIVAAGADDHTIRLWSVARHTLIGQLAGDGSPIADLAFCPGTALLVSASADGQIKLWSSGALDGTVSAGKQLLSIACGPDGMLAAGNGTAVTLWSVANAAHPHVLRTLDGVTKAVTDLAFSPDGSMLAGEEDSDVLLWHLNTGSPMLLRQAASTSKGLAFSHDGTILLTAGTYAEVQLWNTGTGRRVALLARRSYSHSVALAYNPGSGSLALGGPAGSVQFWQGLIPPFTGATGTTGLAVVPHTSLFASVSQDMVLRLWDAAGRLIATANLPDKPAAIAASPDGRLLAVTGSGKTVSVWSVPGLAPVRRLRIPPRATDVAFSPNGRMLAAAAGTSVTIWDAASGASRMHLYSRRGPVEAIAFSPAGQSLAAVTNWGEAISWDTSTGKRVAQTRLSSGAISTLAFRPGGGLLAAAGNDGNVYLLNPADLSLVGTLPGDDLVKALAFGPDGRTLASGENIGTIMLWDTASRSLTATLASGQRPVKTLGFTSDGNTLLSGHGRITAWDLDPGSVVSADCRMLAADPGLSLAEALVPGAAYSRLCPAAR